MKFAVKIFAAAYFAVVVTFGLGGCAMLEAGFQQSLTARQQQAASSVTMMENQLASYPIFLPHFSHLISVLIGPLSRAGPFGCAGRNRTDIYGA